MEENCLMASFIRIMKIKKSNKKIILESKLLHFFRNIQRSIRNNLQKLFLVFI